MYATVIRPSATYACERWVINKTKEKMLPSIYGGIKTKNGREEQIGSRKNCIIAIVKTNRIRWMGHVKILTRERLPKLVLSRKPIGKKKDGQEKHG